MAVICTTADNEIHCPSCGRAVSLVSAAAHTGRHAELRTRECKACGVFYTEAAEAKGASARS